MANRSSNPTPKSYRQHQLDSSTNKRLRRTRKKKGMPSSVPQRSETKLTSDQHRSGLASRFAITRSAREGSFEEPSPRSAASSQPSGAWLGHRARLAIAVLLSSAGLVAMFAWISILFMFNPEHVGWLNQFLPEWAKIHFGEEH